LVVRRLLAMRRWFRLDAAGARLELACVLIATRQSDAADVAGRAFSELAQTMEVVEKNMEAMGA
jgi:hypothetical protein